MNVEAKAIWAQYKSYDYIYEYYYQAIFLTGSYVLRHVEFIILNKTSSIN